MTSKAYRDNYAAIDWQPIPETWRKPRQAANGKGPMFMPDIRPFISPIDYSEISSRSSLRAHERKHDVRQCGDLRKPEDFAAVRAPQMNERALERAYRTALDRKGML